MTFFGASPYCCCSIPSMSSPASQPTVQRNSNTVSSCQFKKTFRLGTGDDFLLIPFPPCPHETPSSYAPKHMGFIPCIMVSGVQQRGKGGWMRSSKLLVQSVKSHPECHGSHGQSQLWVNITCLYPMFRILQPG